jgi:hypothetical protein
MRRQTSEVHAANGAPCWREWEERAVSGVHAVQRQAIPAPENARRHRIIAAGESGALDRILDVSCSVL